MAKRWKKEEETYLKRYAKTRRVAELAERFKTDPEEVIEKLEEMALEAKDTITPMRIENDPLVKVFESGLKAVQKGDYKQAQKHLKRVVDETDFPQLAQRARRYLAVAEQNLKKSLAGGEDPFLLAVYERNRGRLDESLELCLQGGRAAKDERFAYLAASLHALKGDHEAAATSLRAAIDMNPKNRVHAFHDSDFGALRSDSDYASLFEQP